MFISPRAQIELHTPGNFKMHRENRVNPELHAELFYTISDDNREYSEKCAIWSHGTGAYRVVVSTAAFQTRVRGSFPGLGGLKETKMFLLHPLLN